MFPFNQRNNPLCILSVIGSDFGTDGAVPAAAASLLRLCQSASANYENHFRQTGMGVRISGVRSIQNRWTLADI
jgi:hypothetical protein